MPTTEELQIQLDALKELTNFRFCKGQELNSTQLIALADKVATQAEKNEEHFERLNGEWKRVDKVADSNVSQEVYAAEYRALLDKIASINNQLATMEGKASQRSVDGANTAALIGIVVGVLSLLVNILGRFL